MIVFMRKFYQKQAYIALYCKTFVRNKLRVREVDELKIKDKVKEKRAARV